MLILKVPMQKADARMLQSAMHFHLPPQLPPHFLGGEVHFCNHLYGHGHRTLLLDCAINDAELAASQLLIDFEIVDGPALHLNFSVPISVGTQLAI